MKAYRNQLVLTAALIGGLSNAATAQQAPADPPAQAPATSGPAEKKLPPVQVIQEKPKPKPQPKVVVAPAPKKKPVSAQSSTPAPKPRPKAAAAPAPLPEPVVTAVPSAAEIQAAPGSASPAFGTGVAMSPVPGSEIPVEKVPSTVSTISAGDVTRAGQSTLEGALDKRVPGVLINDAQGNSFNTTVQYRGFESSPVPGFASGLAVYQNGVRINEAFGDNVNFDVLPSNAIAGATVMSGNPVFGLNALGGSINIKMKDGFDFQGIEVDARAGSFGRRQVGVQIGQRVGSWAAYLAAEDIHDNGYRNFSSANLQRLYADVGVRGDGNELHLSFTGAHNTVGVAAASPYVLLDIDRALTFTTPQTTENEVAMLALSGSTKVTPTLQLAGVVYGRIFNQHHVDGNLAEIRRCGTGNASDGLPRYGAGTNFLCSSEDDETGHRPAVVDINGNLVPRFNTGTNFGYGSIDRTQQEAKSFGTSVQATDKSHLFGLPNQFLIGASFDHGTVNYGASSELGLSHKNLVVQGTGIILGGESRPRDLTTTNDYIGLFFSNTLDLTRQLSLTVGGRYNFARIELEDNTGSFPDLNAGHSFQRFNPTAGATYKLMPGLTVYGGYSEANRAPTPAELACANPDEPCLIESFLTDDPPLKQVVSHTFEAGLKGELNGIGAPGRINWGLGLFHTLNTNDIIAVAADEAGRGYFRNAGDTLRRGVEASLEYRTERFFGYVGYSYTDATFRNTLEIASANNNYAGPCSADPTNDEVFCSHVKPGDKLPGISPHKVKMGFDYAILPQWKFGADWIWASSQYFYGDEGNVAPKLGARSRVDLHTTYDVTKNIQIYGIVQNVLNTKYELLGTFYSAEAAFNTSNREQPALNTDNQRSAVPAMPFAAYGGMKVKF